MPVRCKPCGKVKMSEVNLERALNDPADLFESPDAVVHHPTLTWTLALSDRRRSCIHPHRAGLFALEDDAIHCSCGHSGAVEADREARVPG